MKEYEFSGKTVEEAIEEGLRTLGIGREEAQIAVLEEGKKGGLFTKAVKARVSMGKKPTDGERAAEFLDGLFELMHVSATTELDEDGEHTRVNVITANTYALVGHRGELLDALQVLAGAVANIGREEYKRIVVDCEGYRDKRELTLKHLAEKLAAKAVRLGRKVSIEPMTPYERRIIHAALADSTEVKTASEGKEPNRYVVVIPNNLRPGADRRGGRGRYDRERRGGYDRERSGYDRRGGYDRDRSGYDNRRKSYDRDAGGDGAQNERRYDRRRDDRRGGYDRDRRERPRATGLPRSKRQPYFGTYLGNSNDMKQTEAPKDEE